MRSSDDVSRAEPLSGSDRSHGRVQPDSDGAPAYPTTVRGSLPSFTEVPALGETTPGSGWSDEGLAVDLAAGEASPAPMTQAGLINRCRHGRENEPSAGPILNGPKTVLGVPCDPACVVGHSMGITGAPYRLRHCMSVSYNAAVVLPSSQAIEKRAKWMASYGPSLPAS